MIRAARHLMFALLLGSVAAACTTSTPASTPTSPTASSTPATPSPGTSPSVSGSPSVEPSPVASLPPGLPPSYPDDVAGVDIAAAALIPLRAEVIGTWRGATSEGEAIVVAWQVPGGDPFALAHGVAAWRRFDDGGAPWRPVWGEAYGKRSGVQFIDGTIADVTGEGSDDILLFRATGGSGACGTAEVVDLAAGSPVFMRDLCDARVDPSVDPVGLVLTEAVFGPGDPHCCPSRMRTTVLVWEDGDWRADSVSTARV